MSSFVVNKEEYIKAAGDLWNCNNYIVIMHKLS